MTNKAAFKKFGAASQKMQMCISLNSFIYFL